ncbi:hypothetical protein [Bradyrhizobium lablabi]|nr:hypothetical protein [Bradyrhizobium lablabi]
MRQIITALFGATALSVASLPGALAADMPVKAPQSAVMVDSWNAYVWLDGSYQRVNLPTYNLGPATNVGGTATYGAQIVSIDPHADGYGISGGAGYFLPQGLLFGSNVRVEIGGSYVRATSSQSASSGAYNLPSSTLQMMDGRFVASFSCAQFVGRGPGLCNSTSTVNTTYDSWQFNGKVATDLKSGAVTFTPSLAIFGGTSRNDQALSHFTNNGFSADNLLYNANTQLRWVDWGARLGADTAIALTNQFSVGLGGSLGFANRRTNLSGNDSVGTTNAGTFATGVIGADANKGVLLANAEANITFQPMKNVSLRTFVGLNYDNSVPGIMAPTFSCPFNAAPALPVPAAAAITFQAETSYYAGSGLTVKF